MDGDDCSLLSLPSAALETILSLLCVSDMPNIRLTCKTLYDRTFFKGILERMRVIVNELNDDDEEHILRYLQKLHYGRFTPVHITCCLSKELAERISYHLRFAKELSFDLYFTQYVVKNCSLVEKLTLISHMPLQECEENDQALIKQSMFVKDAIKLSELTIRGSNTRLEYDQIPASVVNILSKTLLNSLTFDRLRIVKDTAVSSLDSLFIRDTVVPCWKFSCVYVADNFKITLPNTLIHLQCLCSEDIKWLEQHCALEFLEIDALSLPSRYSASNYRNLEHLSFHKVNFCKMYAPVLTHAVSLKLVDCSSVYIYLKLLSMFSDSVKTLHLETTSCSDSDFINNVYVLKILKLLMVDLEVLILTGLDCVTDRFLYDIQSQSLKKVELWNCKNVRKRNAETAALSFEVVIQ